jgi:hypothetical protein
MEKQEYKVVRVARTEVELSNGDIYPHVFELDDDITVEEFQNLLNSSKDMVIDQIKKIEDINE